MSVEAFQSNMEKEQAKKKNQIHNNTLSEKNYLLRKPLLNENELKKSSCFTRES